MAGSRTIDLITDVEEITEVRSLRAFAKRLCNASVAEICGFNEWPFLWTVDWFQTIAPYETGTVTMTEASKTVTGSGTTFTAAMVGRKIRIETETAYYLIAAYVSATEITLEQPYTGTTASSLTFSIYKDEYLLRGDVDTQKQLRDSDNGVAFFSTSASEFDVSHPSPSGTGVPRLSVFSGRATKTYSTGTVSMTSASRVLTGSSTLWTSVEGLTKGTKLKIGTLLFTVNIVNSDTQITVYEVATSDITAGTSYTAILDNYVVQLHSIPSAITTVYYRFQRIPAVLDADNDIPDLPYAMHQLIKTRMLPTFWRHKGMTDRAAQAEIDFDRDMVKWQMKYLLPVLDQKRPIHPFSNRQGMMEAPWGSHTGVPLSR